MMKKIESDFRKFVWKSFFHWENWKIKEEKNPLKNEMMEYLQGLNTEEGRKLSEYVTNRAEKSNFIRRRNLNEVLELAGGIGAAAAWFLDDSLGNYATILFSISSGLLLARLAKETYESFAHRQAKYLKRIIACSRL